MSLTARFLAWLNPGTPYERARRSHPELCYVLDAVNQLRDDIGLDELGDIPAGYLWAPDSCPLARALSTTERRARVSGCEVTWLYGPFPHRRVTTTLPATLREFRYNFDEGRYPELIV